MSEQLPYIINAKGEVVGVKRTYRTLGGRTFVVFIPDPAEPAGGWEPGEREEYMRNLHRGTKAHVQRAMRKVFATSSYWLDSEEPATENAQVVGAAHWSGEYPQ